MPKGTRKKKTAQKISEWIRAIPPYLLSPFSVFSMFKMSCILYKNHLSMDVRVIISSRDMLSSKACQKEKGYFLWQTFYKCLIWLKTHSSHPSAYHSECLRLYTEDETCIIDIPPNKPIDTANYIWKWHKEVSWVNPSSVYSEKIPLPGSAFLLFIWQVTIIS